MIQPELKRLQTPGWRKSRELSDAISPSAGLVATPSHLFGLPRDARAVEVAAYEVSTY
jgi:hypothetical protein